jgi:hypothetical protein
MCRTQGLGSCRALSALTQLVRLTSDFDLGANSVKTQHTARGTRQMPQTSKAQCADGEWATPKRSRTVKTSQANEWCFWRRQVLLGPALWWLRGLKCS